MELCLVNRSERIRFTADSADDDHLPLLALELLDASYSDIVSTSKILHVQRFSNFFNLSKTNHEGKLMRARIKKTYFKVFFSVRLNAELSRCEKGDANINGKQCCHVVFHLNLLNRVTKNC